MAEKRKVERQCPQTTDGKPCSAPLLLNESGYCVFHHPGKEFRELGDKARHRASFHARRLLSRDEVPVLDSSTIEGIMTYRKQIRQLVTQGKITVAVAKFLLEDANEARQDWLAALQRENAAKTDKLIGRLLREPVHKPTAVHADPPAKEVKPRQEPRPVQSEKADTKSKSQPPGKPRRSVANHRNGQPARPEGGAQRIWWDAIHL